MTLMNHISSNSNGCNGGQENLFRFITQNERAKDQTRTDQATKKTKKTSDGASERHRGRATNRPRERATERASRTAKKPSDRATERTSGAGANERRAATRSSGQHRSDNEKATTSGQNQRTGGGASANDANERRSEANDERTRRGAGGRGAGRKGLRDGANSLLRMPCCNEVRLMIQKRIVIARPLRNRDRASEDQATKETKS